MANRDGEVLLEIKGKTYTLALTFDAMAAVEELFSTPSVVVTFGQVASAVDRGSVRHMRGLLWSVLQKHHPDVRIKDVGALIEAAGGLDALNQKFGELAAAAQADPKDLQELGANPHKAQGGKAKASGTGARSTSKRGESA